MPKAESPLFDSSKGLEEKQRARDEAASLMDRNAQGLSASGMGAYAQQLSEDKVRAAAMGTPGVMQQNAAGFQALYQQPAAKAAMPGASTDAEAAANRQKQMDVQGAANIAAFDKTGAPIQSQGQYDAIKAGVSAYYDPASGKWVNSTTGQPQAGTGEGPGTSKYGSTLNGLIANGFSPYYGLTEGQADAIESQKAQGEAEKYKAVSGMQQKANESEAKSLINAGQAGGFMSTQLSGTAANTAGPTWVGSGGVLARIQNENQQRIAEVDKQMSEAIQAATNAARFAYRTGNAQDVQQAQAASAKVAELQDFRTAQAEDLLKRTKAIQEIQKLERATADETLTNIAKSGMAFEQLPAEYAESLDRHFQSIGYPEGYAKSFMDVSKRDADLKRSSAEVANAKDAVSYAKAVQDYENNRYEVAKDILSIQKQIPIGTSQKINGITYTGLDRGAIMQGNQTNDDGLVTAYEVNTATGERKVYEVGYIGKKEDGWEMQVDKNTGLPWQVNAKTGQMKPFFVGEGNKGIQDNIPNGSTWMRNGQPAPECGQYVNDICGAGVGDTYESKMAKTDKTIKAGSENPPRFGDFFVQKLGTWTGHIGMVAETGKDPNGREYVIASENNYPQKGVVQTGRRVYMDEIDGFGRTGKTHPLFQTGTDSKPGTLRAEGGYVPDFGSKSASGAKADHLSPTEVKNLGLDPTDPANIGITLADAKVLRERAVKAREEMKSVTPTYEQFLSDFEKEMAKDESATSFDPDAAKAVYDSTYGAIDSYADAASNLSYKFAGESKGPRFVKEVQSAIEGGDFMRAQDKLRKAAMDTADAVTSQQVRGRDASLKALDSIESDLEKYAARGGKTNIFNGTEEQILKKVGMVDDPELRSIATKIQAAVAEYRRAISGAAFTESEKKEYDSMFPSISNDKDLNVANIRAMREIFTQGNETFYRQQLGNENYDAIFGR